MSNKDDEDRRRNMGEVTKSFDRLHQHLYETGVESKPPPARGEHQDPEDLKPLRKAKFESASSFQPLKRSPLAPDEISHIEMRMFRHEVLSFLESRGFLGEDLREVFELALLGAVSRKRGR